MANDGSGGIDEWRHFVTTLAGKGTVRLLNVSANRLDKTMLRPLAEWVAMGEACTLEELNLAQNALVDGSVGVLLDALQAAQHNRLTILELSENHLASEGAQRLAAFLSSPSCHLQTLKLYRCGIDADGLAAIARAVERNTSLESLTATANGHLSPLWIDRVGRKFLQALMRRCRGGLPSACVGPVSARGPAQGGTRALQATDTHAGDIGAADSAPHQQPHARRLRLTD